MRIFSKTTLSLALAATALTGMTATPAFANDDRRRGNGDAIAAVIGIGVLGAVIAAATSSNRRRNDGYYNNGYDQRGYDNRGYDNRGYDRRGYDNYGYDRNDCDRNGRHREHGRRHWKTHDRDDRNDHGNYGYNNSYRSNDDDDD